MFFAGIDIDKTGLENFVDGIVYDDSFTEWATVKFMEASGPDCEEQIAMLDLERTA